MRFRYDCTVIGIHCVADQVDSVRVSGIDNRTESLTADVYIVAMGSYSAMLLRALGLRIPIYLVKGYSMTMPVADATRAHRVSLTEAERKIVFSRLDERPRIAGTAELNGYSTELNQTRCRALVKRTEELFPSAGESKSARFWTGLGPATPGNVPLIGRTGYSNLLLNTGHGTLGWTHSCGSGQLQRTWSTADGQRWTSFSGERHHSRRNID